MSLVVSLLLFGTALAGSSASDAPDKAAQGKLTVAPRSLAFPVTQVGTSSQMSASLSNASAVAIDITKITAAPTGAGFSAAQTCLGTLASGDACDVAVTFSPTAAKGAKVTGTLTIKDNASNSPQTVRLSGTKLEPFTALTARMRTARAGHTATLLPDGQVLLTGGFDNIFGAALNTAELYDPTANTFTALSARMRAARNFHTATLLLSGQVLITGGSPDPNGNGLRTAEFYDPETQTFTALTAKLTTGRGGHTATLLADGQVLLTGGFDNDGSLNSAELYDPEANTFTALSATMTTAREDHTATLLPNGLVLLTGGADRVHKQNTILKSAEVYDPVEQTFTALTARMTTARDGHTATLLPSGQVLLTGGGRVVSPSALTVLNTAELYDPEAQAFTALTATMTTPRVLHAATLLPNGQVLLTGGGYGPAETSFTVLNTAELYDPSAGE